LCLFVSLLITLFYLNHLCSTYVIDCDEDDVTNDDGFCKVVKGQFSVYSDAPLSDTQKAHIMTKCEQETKAGNYDGTNYGVRWMGEAVVDDVEYIGEGEGDKNERYGDTDYAAANTAPGQTNKSPISAWAIALIVCVVGGVFAMGFFVVRRRRLTGKDRTHDHQDDGSRSWDMNALKMEEADMDNMDMDMDNNSNLSLGDTSSSMEVYYPDGTVVATAKQQSSTRSLGGGGVGSMLAGLLTLTRKKKARNSSKNILPTSDDMRTSSNMDTMDQTGNIGMELNSPLSPSRERTYSAEVNRALQEDVSFDEDEDNSDDNANDEEADVKAAVQKAQPKDDSDSSHPTPLTQRPSNSSSKQAQKKHCCDYDTVMF
jgi:hypothetical protein